MSKSLGNFTSLHDLLSRTDGRAYRLLVLQSHYRSPLEVTPETITAAEESLARLDAFGRRFQIGRGGDQPSVGEGDGEAKARFCEYMDDDLGTPRAMNLIFDLVRSANAAADAGDTAGSEKTAATVLELCGAVGLELRAEEAVVDSETARLLERRDAARSEGDFSTADAIRDQLVDLGWTVEDTPGGTRIRR